MISNLKNKINLNQMEELKYTEKDFKNFKQTFEWALLVNSIIYYKISKIFDLNVHHVTTLNVTLRRPPSFNKVELPNLIRSIP